MRVTLNGEVADVEDGWTIDDVVRSLLDSTRGVAVSVDREVVPRSEWSAFVLAEGSLLEVLAASAGG